MKTPSHLNRARDAASATAGLAHHPNAGASESIRDLLRARGPLSTTQITEALHLGGHSARTLLHNLCNVTGGVEQVPDSSPRRFRLYVPAAERSANVAQPRRPDPNEDTPPLRYDAMTHMRLNARGMDK